MFTKEEKIDRFVEATRDRGDVERLVQHFVGGIASLMEIPEGDERLGAVELIARRHVERRAPEIRKAAVDKYLEHASDEDADGLLALIDLPAFRRYVDINHKIGVEIAQAGVDWGRSVAAEALAEVEQVLGVKVE